MTLEQAVEWVARVPESLPEEMRPMAMSICESFQSTAKRLPQRGLGYLSLDRAGSTLSTGERQRVQLARSVRNRTTGGLYVMDEPPIGLQMPRWGNPGSFFASESFECGTTTVTRDSPSTLQILIPSDSLPMSWTVMVKRSIKTATPPSSQALRSCTCARRRKSSCHRALPLLSQRRAQRGGHLPVQVGVRQKRVRVFRRLVRPVPSCGRPSDPIGARQGRPSSRGDDARAAHRRLPPPPRPMRRHRDKPLHAGYPAPFGRYRQTSCCRCCIRGIGSRRWQA